MHCNFGPYLTRALRDQFVGGVRSQTTKKKLLSEDRTFEQALGVARADELAEKESKLLKINTDQSSSKLQVVNTVNKTQDSNQLTGANPCQKLKGKNVCDVDPSIIEEISVATQKLLATTAKKQNNELKSASRKRGNVKSAKKHTMLLLHLLEKQFQVKLKTINSQST